jgi:hypothetical protein
VSPVRSRLWDGTQFVGGGGTIGWADPWEAGALVGTLKPVGGTNVGAGIFEDRPTPTATLPFTGLPAGVTYNSTTKRFSLAAGVVLRDLVIPGFVTGAAGSELENCRIVGPATEYTGGYLAMVEGPSTSGQMTLRWCTIDPDVASAYYDGIGRGVAAYYCDVKNVVDGVRAMSTSVNGARIQCYACHFHSAVQFRPDYANGDRNETHNDVGCQCQGNPNGDDNDILFDGCWSDARHSLTKGTLPPTHVQIAAVMITPASTQGAVHMTYTRGWLTGGDYCFNAGSNGVNAYGPSSVVVTYNRFERPGTNTYGDGKAPNVALALDPSLARVVTGNVYEDNGAPVPVTNA